jgi:hypothetical protein
LFIVAPPTRVTLSFGKGEAMKLALPLSVSILSCLMILGASPAFSADDGMEQLALRLWEVSSPPSGKDQPESFDDFMKRRFGAEEAAKLKPKERKALEQLSKDLGEKMKEFERDTKAAFIEACGELFTKDELVTLIQFYESSLGQKMVAKLPERMGAILLKKLPAGQGRTRDTAQIYKTLDNPAAKQDILIAERIDAPDR